MKITRADVEHVALLSRLEITEAEIAHFTGQLNAILEYADRLNRVNTDNVPPTAHVLPLQNVWREDAVKPSMPRDKAMANAPAAQDGYFKVPKILEG